MQGLKKLSVWALGVLLAACATTAFGADACTNRSELDNMYCDSNQDMVADVPTDSKKWRNPSTIVFTYTPVEDPAVYENIFKPFTTYLSQCLNKKVVFYQVQSNAAEIEAMRSGRLHVGGFSTGPTAFAVNLAGAIPFAVKGTANEFQGYNLIFIVKASSPYQKLSDLKGKKVAHTSPSSNSGHLAPLALFPKEGLHPTRITRSCSPASTTSRCSASARGTTTARPLPPTYFTGWVYAARSRNPITASSIAARNSRRRPSRTRTTSSRSSRTGC